MDGINRSNSNKTLCYTKSIEIPKPLEWIYKPLYNPIIHKVIPKLQAGLQTIPSSILDTFSLNFQPQKLPFLKYNTLRKNHPNRNRIS